jgi:hypothetical protein
MSLAARPKSLKIQNIFGGAFFEPTQRGSIVADQEAGGAARGAAATIRFIWMAME